MAIPKETNKELVVIVENESLEVAISPPVLDSVFVVGQPPQPDPRTVLFSGYQDETLTLRTTSGLVFNVDPVAQQTTQILEQVIYGQANPTDIDNPGQNDGRIYVATNSRSFYVWEAGSPDWVDPQVIYGTTLPISGLEEQIFINTADRSIRVFRT